MEYSKERDVMRGIITLGFTIVILLGWGFYETANAASDIRIIPQEAQGLLSKDCRAAHDRLEHDMNGNIKGISTFYVCPGKVVKIYRGVE